MAQESEIEKLIEEASNIEIEPVESSVTNAEKEAIVWDTESYNPPQANNVEDFIKLRETKLKLDDADSERKLREDNASKAFYFSAAWALMIAAIVIGRAFCPCFRMNENEYIATIGTLSITILTYYMLVIRYLFYRKLDNTK